MVYHWKQDNAESFAKISDLFLFTYKTPIKQNSIKNVFDEMMFIVNNGFI